MNAPFESPVSVAAENGADVSTIAAQLVSGYGSYHTAKADAKAPRPYIPITLEQVRAMMDAPQQVEKSNARWFIPSSVMSRELAEQRINGQYFALWADLDKVLGETFDSIVSRTVGALACELWVYASRSATEQNPKSRVIIPLAAPITGEQFVLMQRVLNDRLRAAGIEPDSVNERPNQLCYLPNRGEFYQTYSDDYAPRLHADEWESEVQALQATDEREQAEQQAQADQAGLKPRSPNLTGKDAGIIDLANNAYDMDSVLRAQGYKQIGKRYISPSSESGVPAILIFEREGKNVIYSFHGGPNDPLSRENHDGHALDTFDVLVALQYGGDVKRAIAELANQLDADGQKRRQRAYLEGQEAQAQAAPQTPSDWPDPIELTDALLPVDPFDYALLPDIVRANVEDVSERMQCPPDFAAIATMVSLSSAIGRRACLQPKRHDDWVVIPNLWGLAVGRPGLMKSPAIGQAIKPLERLQFEAMAAYREAMKEHEVDAKLHKMQQDGLEKKAKSLVDKGQLDDAKAILASLGGCDDDSTKPKPPRYIVTDATAQALGEILIDNPHGVMLFRDEIDALLRTLSKDERSDDRGLYLQGYDATGSYTFDRIMRGLYLHIPAVCLAMLGSIQPGRLRDYIRSATRGDTNDYGLIQRFGLLVWPDISTEWRNVDKWPDSEAKRRVYETVQRLAAIQPESSITGELEPRVFRFSNEAQEAFDDWRENELEPSLRTGERLPALDSHYSKYRKLVPALALTCSLTDGEAEVSIKSTLRALAWAKYLSTHAERAYDAGARPSTEAASALLARIRSGHVQDGFKARDIYRHGWAHLQTPEKVTEAAERLVDFNYLHAYEPPRNERGGRPTVTYSINPKALA